MSRGKRILWGEGMFLRPQHFQQQALYEEQQRAHLANAVRRHGWGLAGIEFDDAALKCGQVRLDRLSIRFRDGTSLVAPGLDPLPVSRELNEIPTCGTRTTLYACLPDLRAYGGNVLRESSPPGKTERYARHTGSVADLYTTALETELTCLHLNVQLRVAEENRDGFDALPVACLLKDGSGHWQIDDSYLPPMTELGASPLLTRLLRRLLDILAAKCAALTALHRERTAHVMEYTTSDIASFWLLHTVNRNHARLRHLHATSPVHPEELYMALAELCGELLTFSRTEVVADLPAYRHDDLAATFLPLDERIRDLLDTVISSRYVAVPLNSAKPSFHIGHLDSDRLVDGVDFYLSVQTELPLATVIESIPYKLKVGAPDDVDKILNSAVRGVALAHATQTPSSIPVRVGNHYFALEPHGEIYQRMLQARSICIYVPQTLAAVKLELLAVFR